MAPRAPSEDEPVLSTKAPPALVPEPVAIVALPPAAVLGVVADVEPDERVKDPPVPRLPEPTVMEMAPPFPPVAAPEPIEIAPVLPTDEVPELRMT